MNHVKCMKVEIPLHLQLFQFVNWDLIILIYKVQSHKAQMSSFSKAPGYKLMLLLALLQY